MLLISQFCRPRASSHPLPVLRILVATSISRCSRLSYPAGTWYRNRFAVISLCYRIWPPRVSRERTNDVSHLIASTNSAQWASHRLHTTHGQLWLAPNRWHHYEHVDDEWKKTKKREGEKYTRNTTRQLAINMKHATEIRNVLIYLTSVSTVTLCQFLF